MGQIAAENPRTILTITRFQKLGEMSRLQWRHFLHKQEQAMMRVGEVFKWVAQKGFRGLMIHLYRRALVFVPGGSAFRVFLVVLTQPLPTPEAMASARNHTFTFATLDDLRALLNNPDAEIYERDIQSFQGGNRCLLQRDGAKLVGYTWISNSALIDIDWGLHVNLPDDMFYNYNGYTTRAYRGTAYQALRHLKILEMTSHEGKHRLFGYVNHLNYKSLRGVTKSGYQKVGVLRGVRRNGRVYFSLSIDDGAWGFATRVGPQQH